MLINEPETGERHLMHNVCLGAIICSVLVLFLLALSACSGTLLALQSRQEYPADEAVRAYAVKTFAFMVTLHGGATTIMLFAAFLLVTLSVLFGLHVGDFQPKRTKHAWMQTIRAGALAAVLFANMVWGRMYGSSLVELNFWLTPPPGGFLEGATVAKGQVISAATFSTFLAFHAVLLPLVAIMLIILMWPAFYEFVPTPQTAAQNKWLNLSRPRGI
jgi:hypothetical protein